MEAQATQKQNITEHEVNHSYGIGVRQLRMMRLRGTGPRYIKVSGQLGKKGGRILYPVEEVAKWLKSLPTGGGGRQ
jgi:hypothetical protein